MGTQAKQGVKYDNGKLRYDLIPIKSLQSLAWVYTNGAIKYGDRNWEKGILYSRIYAAMMRHLTAWFDGEDLDKEDGQHHLASVAWGAFALLFYGCARPEMDDRPNKNKEPEHDKS